jgi:hypothetical protein
VFQTSSERAGLPLATDTRTASTREAEAAQVEMGTRSAEIINDARINGTLDA